jgi:hypothetical protein
MKHQWIKWYSQLHQVTGMIASDPNKLRLSEIAKMLRSIVEEMEEEMKRDDAKNLWP